MYSAIQIADFFIEKHMKDKEKPIEPIELQKLVYISYGWYWALQKKELFKDEIQAWKYGPVIPAVWHVFRNQGDKIEKPSGMETDPPLDEITKKMLDVVYEAYIDQGSSKMISITHAPGTPWSSVYNGERERKIPKEVIWKYYELLRSEREKAIQK